MARKLDYPSSTVMSWVRRGSIPSRHIPVVIEAAKREGVELSAADFFKLPEAAA